MNLLQGPGHQNQGRGGTFQFNWKDWNIPCRAANLPKLPYGKNTKGNGCDERIII